jgi:UDP-3-O-[3-hydroxymyristoyl] glucosamine N-acyltransferase
MKNLVIFGNASMAKVSHYYFSRDSDYTVAAFTVDAGYNDKGSICGLEVLDFERIEDVYPPDTSAMFIAIGPSRMNGVREAKFLDAKKKGYRLASYLSPRSVCGSVVGENTFVADMVVIAPFVTIGHDNYFYDGAICSNDAIIGSHCYFAPRSYVGSLCDVRDNSILGAGAVLKSGVVVARQTLVGASAYISANTQENGVYGERNSEIYGRISDKLDISR